jgi:hypothetical protein
LGGPPAELFDFGNSPAALLGRDLCGRRIIQYTPNGTRGVVRSVKAETLLTGSFVCAGATQCATSSSGRHPRSRWSARSRGRRMKVDLERTGLVQSIWQRCCAVRGPMRRCC